ncbi:MAG: hypothetical protein CMJ18_25145 [Phycisphaeraceae bacterium]|nr:hypothetical protein [Phycisphaeraceae bacterium]
MEHESAVVTRSGPPPARVRIARALPLGIIAAAALLNGACTTIRVTDPPRTATEQFLLSEAAARSIEQLEFEPLRGHRVFVDDRNFAAEARQFVIGQVRGKLLTNGVPLVEKREEAEIVMEIRSRGVGIDRYGTLIGLPPIPIRPAAEGVSVDAALTVELAFYKNTKQLGFASIAYVAYWRDTGEVVVASGPFVGKTRRDDTWFFGFGPSTVGNVPTVKHEMQE